MLGLEVASATWPPAFSFCPAVALFARADAAKMLVRINPRVVAVAPIDTDGVVTDRFHRQHFERRLEHRKGRGGRSGFGLPGLRPMRAGAARARALVAHPDKPIIAVVPVFPVDLDSLGLGNGYVFGVG